MKRIEDPMLKLILAKTQVSNVIELIKDNEFEQHLSTKLWSVYYELERQQKNLKHQQKMGVTLAKLVDQWLWSRLGILY